GPFGPGLRGQGRGASVSPPLHQPEQETAGKHEPPGHDQCRDKETAPGRGRSRGGGRGPVRELIAVDLQVGEARVHGGGGGGPGNRRGGSIGRRRSRTPSTRSGGTPTPRPQPRTGPRTRSGSTSAGRSAPAPGR